MASSATYAFFLLLVAPLAYASAAESPTPAACPLQFHSILYVNYSGSLSLIDLWYDWTNGRNYNIIQDQLGSILYDVEWNKITAPPSSSLSIPPKRAAPRSSKSEFSALIGSTAPNTSARRTPTVSSATCSRSFISFGITRMSSPSALCIGCSTREDQST